MRTTRRPDWLGGAAVALVIILGFVAVLAVAGLAEAARRSPTTVAVPISALSPLTGAGLRDLAPGASLDPAGTADVVVADPTTSQVLWSLTTWLPALAIGVAVLVLLLTVVTGARRGDPFTDRTIGRLRAIGILTLLGGPITIALGALARSALSDSVLAGSGDLSPAITLDWLIVGMGFLALAEVIRRGRSMRQELDEVI